MSMRHDGFTQMSQPMLGEFAEPVGLATEMLYACPNVAVTHRLVGVNCRLPTYMRAPGEASGDLRAGIGDGRAGGRAAAWTRWSSACATTPSTDPHENKPFASKALRECYRAGRGARSAGRGGSPEPRSMRDGNMLIGWGMATSTYPTNRMPAGARVRHGCRWQRRWCSRARRISAPAPTRSWRRSRPIRWAFRCSASASNSATARLPHGPGLRRLA